MAVKKIFATYLGTVSLERCPYLTLAKTGPATAKTGELITYTLTLTNSGNLTATAITITDTLPVAAVYVSGGTPVDDAVSWSVSSLDLGGTLTRTFSVTASRTITNSDYAVRSNSTITATGTVSVVTTIAPELTITKLGPATITKGSPITYTLWVTNRGGLATHLIITDAIPTNATYLTGGTRVGGVVSWFVPSLAFGYSLSRTFSITSQQLVTNNRYRVTADGNISATGAISVVTAIVDAPDTQFIPIYLPLILKGI